MSEALCVVCEESADVVLRVLSEAVATNVTDVLRGVITSGTGRVVLRVVLADAEGDSPWCMDCAADVVAAELAEVVGPVRRCADGDRPPA